MNSNDNLFEDIEQDNNPSFYGNQSILNDPYGRINFNGMSINPSLSSPNPTHPNPPPPPPYTSTGLESPDSVKNGGTDLVNSTIGLSNKIGQLLEDPELQIDIVSSERLVNSSVIVYTIQLSLPDNSISIIVKRRYSEFKSLRDNLIRLFPTLIIPPIPEKHSIFTYLINSINNSNEINIIEMRKRYFKRFLVDVIFESSPKLKECSLLHKFLDPNYELCWYNALHEPPVNLIPNNLLLSNPVDPTDQTGLYSLLPLVNGFEFDSNIDNLSSLKKLNEEWKRLNEQIKLFEFKSSDYYKNEADMSDITIVEDHKFTEIPSSLTLFEIKFHNIIKILQDLNKLNSRNVKNYKGVVNNLVELGGNLNNFSLQIFESSNHTMNSTVPSNNNLSVTIEKFGSTIDSSFLNFESFIINHVIPEWQEPIHQLIQYYLSSLTLIKFYKYKIIQFKILYKLKFNKFQELLNLTNATSTSLATAISNANNNNGDSQNATLDHLKDLNSPTITNALQKLESRKRRTQGLQNKKSWYGLFGGNNKSYSFNLAPEELQSSGSNKSQHLPQANNFKFKYNQIEKELNKLNQLIEMCDRDMINLTQELIKTFNEFLKELEKKWLRLMISYIKSGKELFTENLNNWEEFKQSVSEEV
ncbi:uncharacterized protein RJT20DRAFT_130808 [Scheffersomyces xylosifermentans]|uniref:uncharacterized protein n=1 Tax=Scheffersomyces xylosifermentans TaxID=1304137 RepID=UPI00315D962B